MGICSRQLNAALNSLLKKQKFEELLDLISLTPTQVKIIAAHANQILKKQIGNSGQIIEARTKQIAEVTRKIERWRSD